MLRKAKDKGLPIRIGVNAGSLEKELVEKYGFPCPPAMVESALRYLEIAESEGVKNIIVSLKSSDVLTAVEAYRMFAKQADYPTHIGITEAGKPPYAVTKSACGLAPLLLDGIGDTIRISLLGDPVPEIQAAFDNFINKVGIGGSHRLNKNWIIAANNTITNHYFTSFMSGKRMLIRHTDGFLS